MRKKREEKERTGERDIKREESGGERERQRGEEKERREREKRNRARGEKKKRSECGGIKLTHTVGIYLVLWTHRRQSKIDNNKFSNDIAVLKKIYKRSENESKNVKRSVEESKKPFQFNHMK